MRNAPKNTASARDITVPPLFLVKSVDARMHIVVAIDIVIMAKEYSGERKEGAREEGMLLVASVGCRCFRKWNRGLGHQISVFEEESVVQGL